MKTLEQLGISPAPWKPADDGIGYNDILCNVPVTEDSEGYNIIAEAVDAKDARLIAAAPELYAALFEMVEMYRDGGSYDYEQEVIKMAKSALAKAAGEREVK